MICTRCSTELPEEAVACYRCGTVTDATFVRPLDPVQAGAVGPEVVKPATRSVTILVTVAITLLAVIIVAGMAGAVIYFAMRSNSNQRADIDTPQTPAPVRNERQNKSKTVAPSPTVQTTPQTPLPTPMPASTRSFIFNGSEVIGADSSRSWTFHVGSNGARLSGKFEADGGLKGEITCYVAAADEAENLGRGLQGKVYYNSSRVHVGKVDIQLNEGEYVVLFRNPSPWTQRIVRGQFILEQ